MKTFAPLILCTAIATTLLATPARAEDDQQLLTLVTELKAQQAQISDHETKIEAKLTDLAETIRTARIFMSRTGGTHKPAPLPKK
jgi:hypothetical protein